MPVPDFQSFIRPMLDYLGEGTPRSLTEIREHLKASFALTEADMLDMLPSGVRSRFADRVYWANTHLYQAGLVSRPSNGVLAITDRGCSFLKTHTGKILVSDLMQFPEYATFRGKGQQPAPGRKPQSGIEKTAQERIDEAFVEMQASVERELLDKVVAASPVAFERLVIQLLVKMGYGGGERDAAQHLGGSGDGGVDGVINQDILGLDRVYIQAKRWKGSVGADRIYAFAGSLEAKKATKGVILTTATFTDAARKALEPLGKRVVLIDGEELVRYMVNFGLGVRSTRKYHVVAIDSDAFDEFEA
jgi:restriction system protein